MHRIPVVSTCVASVGYDEQQRVLEVQFVGGGIYHYFAVPPMTYYELMDAESKGEYFHAFIRDIYNYRPLRMSRR